MAVALMGMMKRIMEPGCKYDYCIVLKGPQGIGKSSFWRTLASDPWFCDTHQDNDKDLRMLINTTWVYELSELESTTSKKEVGALKALLSSSIDSFRIPYGKAMGKFPRPSIIVGTVNPEVFLKDTTGNRRFPVIEVLGDIDLEKLKADRDQILKAAFVAWQNGRLPMLTKEQQAESDGRNNNYEEENIWLAPIGRWLNNAPEVFSTNQVLNEAIKKWDSEIKPQDQRLAADALRKLGCHQDKNQKTKGGHKTRWWQRNISDDSHVQSLSEGDFYAAETAYGRDSTQISDEKQERIQGMNQSSIAPSCKVTKKSKKCELNLQNLVGSSYDISQTNSDDPHWN